MRYLRLGLFFLFVVGVAGFDFLSKQLAVMRLDHEGLQLISGLLSLERAHNTDMAFGLLSSLIAIEPRLLLLKGVATLGTLGLMGYAVARFSDLSVLGRLAFGLLIGGAAGNAIDRWRFGYVVDFIRVPHWPVFNVADIALTLGAGLLMLMMIQSQPKPGQVRS